MKASGRRARRGVSLMEVLISIFVILFGLLSVAALLPVGRFEIAQAMRADRAAACGRAALRDVQVRGLANPALWLAPNLTPVAPPVPPPNGPPAMLPVAAFASFAIDPLYIAANSGAPMLQTFPYNAANGMVRVTLGQVMSVNPQVHERFFERVFTWRDDLRYSLPGDVNARAVVGFNTTTGATEVDGNYTWLVTVTPLVDHLPDWPPASPTYYRADGLRKFEVATVVFHKRDFTLPDPESPKPSERQYGVEFLGAGWGGGDVVLSVAAGNRSHLDMKRNEWILLCGLDPAQQTPWLPLGRPVFKWYRIAAVSEFDPSDPTRRMVTLAGPDWRYSPVNVWGAMFTGVTGVYTETIEVGGPR